MENAVKEKRKAAVRILHVHVQNLIACGEKVAVIIAATIFSTQSTNSKELYSTVRGLLLSLLLINAAKTVRFQNRVDGSITV